MEETKSRPMEFRVPSNFALERARRVYADMAIRIYGGYSPTKIDLEERRSELLFQVPYLSETS